MTLCVARSKSKLIVGSLLCGIFKNWHLELKRKKNYSELLLFVHAYIN